MAIESMEDLFLDELRDLYSAEKQIVKALPKMVKAASSTELNSALSHHLEETKGHVERLEKIFEALGKRGTGKTCVGMKGVLDEGSEMIGEMEDKGPVRDAGIISAAQRVEHYEIAAYGSARTFAQVVGRKDAARLLEQTLEEEKAADKKLSSISDSVNEEAKAAA